MKQEARESNSDEAISMKELLTAKELRWPLITGLVLQLAQQLCGINAVIFKFQTSVVLRKKKFQKIKM